MALKQFAVIVGLLVTILGGVIYISVKSSAPAAGIWEYRTVGNMPTRFNTSTGRMELIRHVPTAPNQ